MPGRKTATSRFTITLPQSTVHTPHAPSYADFVLAPHMRVRAARTSCAPPAGAGRRQTSYQLGRSCALCGSNEGRKGRPHDVVESLVGRAIRELERRFAHYLRAVITPRVAATVTATAVATSSDETGSTTFGRERGESGRRGGEEGGGK